MKVSNVILLSLAAAFVIIGTHLTMTQGLTTSYPVFMLAVALLFWYKFRQNSEAVNIEEPELKKRNRRKSRNK